MQAFNQTFITCAFETTDREEILEAIETIERVETKITKKKEQKRDTKTEQRKLEEAREVLFKKALDPARRPQPDLPKDYNKPTLGIESLMASRALFIYLDSHSGTGDGINDLQLREKIDALVAAVRMDGVDYEAIKVEETPVLSFEQPGANMVPVDESRKFLNQILYRVRT
jgi:hypothetical protein